MKVQRTLGKIDTPQNRTRWNEHIGTVLAGNVSYGSSMSNKDEDTNLSIWKAQGTSPVTPNTNFTLTHTLGRIPNTIVGQDTNNGGVLYRGGAWTKTAIILKCTTASAEYNLIVA